jgi:hypothetical protein
MNAIDIENSSKGGMYYNGKYLEIKISVSEVKKVG